MSQLNFNTIIKYIYENEYLIYTACYQSLDNLIILLQKYNYINIFDIIIFDEAHILHNVDLINDICLFTKYSLFSSATPTDINNENINNNNINYETLRVMIEENKENIVLNFSAKWCGPCKAYAPIFDKVLEETSEWESVVIDVDENSEMAKEYNVRSIPMTILEVDGNIVDKKTGLVKETDLSNLLT